MILDWSDVSAVYDRFALWEADYGTVVFTAQSVLFVVKKVWDSTEQRFCHGVIEFSNCHQFQMTESDHQDDLVWGETQILSWVDPAGEVSIKFRNEGARKTVGSKNSWIEFSAICADVKFHLDVRMPKPVKSSTGSRPNTSAVIAVSFDPREVRFYCDAKSGFAMRKPDRLHTNFRGRVGDLKFMCERNSSLSEVFSFKNMNIRSTNARLSPFESDERFTLLCMNTSPSGTDGSV